MQKLQFAEPTMRNIKIGGGGQKNVLLLCNANEGKNYLRLKIRNYGWDREREILVLVFFFNFSFLGEK